VRLSLGYDGKEVVDSPFNVIHIMREKRARDLIHHDKFDRLGPLVFRRKRGHNVCRDSMRIPKSQIELLGLVVSLQFSKDIER
jgi:hypothetical protein